MVVAIVVVAGSVCTMMSRMSTGGASCTAVRLHMTWCGFLDCFCVFSPMSSTDREMTETDTMALGSIWELT
jgi:hypothetical protein